MNNHISLVPIFECPLEQVQIQSCPVTTCIYHTEKNENRCITADYDGIPDGDDVSDTDARMFKGMSREELKTEKLRGQRWIRRGLFILRICEWMKKKPEEWFQMRPVYASSEVKKALAELKEFPWTLADCGFDAGKVFMILREKTWTEWEADTGIRVGEPHLRVLRLTPEAAETLSQVYVNTYHKLIAQAGNKAMEQLNGKTHSLRTRSNRHRTGLGHQQQRR